MILPIRFLGVERPFVGAAGVIVIEPEAIVIRVESVAETNGWVGSGGVGLRTWKTYLTQLPFLIGPSPSENEYRPVMSTNSILLPGQTALLP